MKRDRLRNAVLSLALCLSIAVSPAAVSAAQQCDFSPLVVTGSLVSAYSVEFTVHNPTSSSVTAYVWIEGEVGGQSTIIYGELTVAAGATITFEAESLAPITLVTSISLCEEPPDGPSEGSDPIIVQVEIQTKPD